MFYNCSELSYDASNLNVNENTSHINFNEGAPGVIAPAIFNS